MPEGDVLILLGMFITLANTTENKGGSGRIMAPRLFGGRIRPE